MNSAIDNNLDLEALLLRRKQLRRELLSRPGLTEVRVAILGGSTTNEVVDFLEVLLLQSGFRPVFYQSEYGAFYETAVLETTSLITFKPQITYIHTSSMNINHFPDISSTEQHFESCLQAELGRFRTIWTTLAERVGCLIIQNNFEASARALLGNLDVVSPGGATRFINELNRLFAEEARGSSHLIVQDQCSLAARIGGLQWFDPVRWFSYKLASSAEGSYELARSLAALIRANYGKSRKVLVVDLDNTLWGGVIGDDGVDNIVLGRETPLGEAYTSFQEYCLSLKRRGILLAVCSKNDEATAKTGFSHPDSVLKLEDFSAFKANWDSKPENIEEIARELNLGVDSFVFVDDNPAERAIVAAQLPGVAVPDVGIDVTRFALTIESQRYFEVLSIGVEDVERTKFYEHNAIRAHAERQFTNYDEYLDFLEMSAEIEPFCATYLDRIAQLTNKSNQYNLTTRRYSKLELESVANDGKHIALYGKLADRFGDNGLVTVVLGKIVGQQLHLDLWLMSCRVLKREMEFAMLDAIVEHTRQRRITELVGYYFPTSKNRMVLDHYQKLGFTLVSHDADSGDSVWSLDTTTYMARNRHIRILEPQKNG